MPPGKTQAAASSENERTHLKGAIHPLWRFQGALTGSEGWLAHFLDHRFTFPPVLPIPSTATDVCCVVTPRRYVSCFHWRSVPQFSAWRILLRQWRVVSTFPYTRFQLAGFQLCAQTGSFLEARHAVGMTATLVICRQELLSLVRELVRQICCDTTPATRIRLEVQTIVPIAPLFVL